MTQQVGQHDIILISDYGGYFLVRTEEVGPNQHKPVAVVPLDPQFHSVPEELKNYGVELADIRDNVIAAGCSCILLNLARLSGASDNPGSPPTLAKKKRPTAKAKAAAESAAVEEPRPAKKKRVTKKR